jgi:hypothetical protein
MKNLDFIRMEKFSGFSVADSLVLARGISEPGKQYALYLFHGSRKCEDWPQGATASRFNVEMAQFTDTVTINATSGKFRVEWITPSSGTVIKTYVVESSDGRLILYTPLYTCDIALRIKRI